MLTSSGWRDPPNLTFFTRGLALGGLATGVLLLLPAALAQEVVPYRGHLLVLLAALAAACDAGLLGFRFPQNARQVPSTIIARTDGDGALQFGFEMGTGLRTFLPTHLPYLAAATVLLASPWWASPTVGLCFGLGRIIMVRSAVHSGNASRWDRAFAENRRVILVSSWVAVGAAVGIAFVTITPLG